MSVEKHLFVNICRLPVVSLQFNVSRLICAHRSKQAKQNNQKISETHSEWLRCLCLPPNTFLLVRKKCSSNAGNTSTFYIAIKLRVGSIFFLFWLIQFSSQIKCHTQYAEIWICIWESHKNLSLGICVTLLNSFFFSSYFVFACLMLNKAGKRPRNLSKLVSQLIGRNGAGDSEMVLLLPVNDFQSSIRPKKQPTQSAC